MGQAEKVLTVAAAEWGDSIAAILAPCFTVAGGLELVADQVLDGSARVFGVECGGLLVGAFVLRVEGRQGVIVAAGGKLDGADLTPVMFPHIEARFVGCESVRFHTSRPGMAKLAAGFGYIGQEVVLSKVLNSDA